MITTANQAMHQRPVAGTQMALDRRPLVIADVGHKSMNRYNTILMLAVLALSGCVSSTPSGREVSFACRDLNEDLPQVSRISDRDIYSGCDGAYVILISRFYPAGHLRWRDTLFALANVAPYMTTVHLEGTIVRTIKGEKQPGDSLTLVETWRIKGYSPLPGNHPVARMGVGSWMPPTPALMVLQETGTIPTITLGNADTLDPSELVACHRQSFHAFVEATSQYVGRPIDHFAIVPDSKHPTPLTRTSREKVEAFIDDCIRSGYAPEFSTIWDEGTHWLYATQGSILHKRVAGSK